MPLYDYRCAACGKLTEVRHGFNDTHLEPCQHCGGALNRVFNPAPIVFKGSGFYVTDSRSSSKSSAPASSESPGSSSSKSSSSESSSSESSSGSGSSSSGDSAA
jgi:putative FmdB family regulatory protein